MGVVDIVIFVAFIASVISLGIFKSKDEKTDGADGASEFFLAGRGLKWWLIGFSLIAANISAEQFVGMSGSSAGYMGIAIASYEWMAAITLVVVAFAFLPYFLKAGIFTIPQFLETRYNHWARSIMAIFMLTILVVVSFAAVVYAGALPMMDLLSQADVNLNLTTCCWIMGLFAAAYVAFGGLKACAWADLIQGSALIIAGGIITYLALDKLGVMDPAKLVDATGAVASNAAGLSGAERFTALNEAKLHMVLPASDSNIPWTALVIGLWIPNFYYWGLNQYITQRVLGSASLKEGQKGIVFAAALKLIIPFIIVFPGIIAFNMYSKDMAQLAANDEKIVKANDQLMEAFEKDAASDENPITVYTFDKGWEEHNKEKAVEIAAYNELAVANAKAAGEQVEEKAFVGYKYDSAMSLLIGKLVPKNGLFGFIIAALLGAIISSLAAILNAASTIFTMDIYGRYISKNAAQKTLVKVGRICIGVFVVIGCVIAPQLANPNFGGIFKYIQEFQGYISPGILAVFIFGLINRQAWRGSGVIGLAINPFIYGALAKFAPQIAFLDRMAICLGSVLALMTIIGLIKKEDKPIEFTSDVDMDTTSSRPALIAGIGVVILTLILYGIFW